MTAQQRARWDYGPVQLADHLGLGRWQQAEVPDPDAPIPYTLAPQADAYLSEGQAGLPDPEPEASL